MWSFQRKTSFKPIIERGERYFPRIDHQLCPARRSAYEWMRNEMSQNEMMLRESYPFWCWKEDCPPRQQHSLLTREEQNGETEILVVRFVAVDCLGLESSYLNFTKLILAYKNNEALTTKMLDDIYKPLSSSDVQVTFPYFDPQWITSVSQYK